MFNKSFFKEGYFWFTKVWVQLIILLCIPFVTSLLASEAISSDRLTQSLNNNYFLIAIYQLFSKNGVGSFFVIFFATFIVIFLGLRRMNENTLLNDGQHIYLENQYKKLWIASKLLGYNKLHLVGVSLPLQFKLVFNGVFQEYLTDSSTTNYEDFSGEVFVDDSDILENNALSSTMLLLVCDTYDIRDSQIGDSYKNIPKVKVSSSAIGSGIRYDNPILIATVREVTQKYIPQFQNVILLTTMNPKNSIKVIGDSFSQSGRNGFDKISVVQMDNSHTYTKEVVVFKN